MANIDLGNLTRYDGKIKQYAEDKYLSKNTANWQITEKAGAVTCYPVPDTELEPIVDFSFKEIPPAEGDKSPSNPSTIEGISNINITRCGKNLVYNLDTNTIGGISFTANIDGSITVNNPVTTNPVTFYRLLSGESLKTGLTYSVSGCPLDSSNQDPYSYLLRFGNHTLPIDVGYGASWTVIDDSISRQPLIRVAGTALVNNVVIYPQVELGGTVTSFEKGEGNTYIYSLGDTYYGGSVNLATGLMTVTWKGKSFDGTEDWLLAPNELNGYKVFFYTGFNSNSSTIIASPETQVCTHYPIITNLTYLSNHSYITNSRIWIVSSETSLESFKGFLASQSLAGTPVIAVCKTTPYTVQLDPAQIKSLTALDKNTPRLNTLYTDADSIQVGYQKHPARTAYELENAILALGGGE